MHIKLGSVTKCLKIPCWGPRGARPLETAAAPESLVDHNQQTGRWSFQWWSWSPSGWCTCTDQTTRLSWWPQTLLPLLLYGQECWTWRKEEMVTQRLSICRCFFGQLIWTLTYWCPPCSNCCWSTQSRQGRYTNTARWSSCSMCCQGCAGQSVMHPDPQMKDSSCGF